MPDRDDWYVEQLRGPKQMGRVVGEIQRNDPASGERYFVPIRKGPGQGAVSGTTYGGFGAGGPHRGRGPRGYKRSDERILEDVSDTLAAHPDIDAADMEVQVTNGEVTIRGTVDDRRGKWLVEELVEQVLGVKDVNNLLRVKQSSSAHRWAPVQPWERERSGFGYGGRDDEHRYGSQSYGRGGEGYGRQGQEYGGYRHGSGSGAAYRERDYGWPGHERQGGGQGQAEQFGGGDYSGGRQYGGQGQMGGLAEGGQGSMGGRRAEERDYGSYGGSQRGTDPSYGGEYYGSQGRTGGRDQSERDYGRSSGGILEGEEYGRSGGYSRRGHRSQRGFGRYDWGGADDPGFSSERVWRGRGETGDVLGGRPAGTHQQSPIPEGQAVHETGGGYRSGQGVDAGSPSGASFGGGGAPPDDPPEEDDQEGTAIERHPSIQALGPAVARKPLTIAVDLLRYSDDATDGLAVEFSRLPADWKSLEVGVEVQSAQLDFKPGENSGKIILNRDAPSIRCQVTGTVLPEAEERGFIDILATFEHEGRFAGHARRSIQVEREGKTAKPRDSAKRSGLGKRPDRPSRSFTVTRGGARFEPDAAAPELTVKIFQASEDLAGPYLWSFGVRQRIDGLPPTQNALVDLGEEPDAFMRRLLEQCPSLEPGSHGDHLCGVGQQLWEKAPANFRETYWALRKRLGKGFPIQFVSDDPYVPWELMYPDDESEDKSEEEVNHLFLDHPVGRWLAKYESWMNPNLPSGRMVSVAPLYPERKWHLPYAQAEGQWLKDKFKALRLPGEFAIMRNLLQKGLPDQTVAVLHFAGHGRFGTDVEESGLAFADGWMTVPQVRSTRVKLGRRNRSFVILNACEAGVADSVLGTIGGWVEAFTKRRFSGIIAPLWSVFDNHASQLIRDVVQAVWGDGKSIGEALREVRARQSANSATPYAYIYFGDVMAQAPVQKVKELSAAS